MIIGLIISIVIIVTLVNRLLIIRKKNVELHDLASWAADNVILVGFLLREKSIRMEKVGNSEASDILLDSANLLQVRAEGILKKINVVK